MSPDQREQLVRIVIALAIFTVAVGGLFTIFNLESGC